MGLKIACQGNAYSEADRQRGWAFAQELKRQRIAYTLEHRQDDQTFAILVDDSVCLTSDVYP